jgi:GxxExxY protein
LRDNSTTTARTDFFHHKGHEGHKGKSLHMRPNDASHGVITAAMKVHTALGAGLLESAYDACLYCELAQAGMHFEHQVKLPVTYSGIRLPAAYRVDFIVEDCLLVEVKCVEKLLPVHVAQVLSYLKLSGYKLGLLINFNIPHLRHGIRRIINGPESEL